MRWPFLSILLFSLLVSTHICGIVFFLNPHIPFTLASFLPLFFVYSLLLIPVTTLVLLLSWKLRIDLAKVLTAALAAQALIYWIHAHHYSFFLPPGINRRLIKAAIALSLSSLICFYTLLLYRIKNVRVERHSKALFSLLALLSVYIVLERREAYRPTVVSQPRSVVYQRDRPLQIYVLGIESATLDAILPLEEQGHLPFISHALKEGAHTRMEPILPVRREALWTSLCTGKYPFKHNIVGAKTYSPPFIPRSIPLNLLPVGLGFRYWGVKRATNPVDLSDATASPIWNILSTLNSSATVIGWPLTRSYEDSLRTLISENFFSDTDSLDSSQFKTIERAKLFRPAIDEIDRSIISEFGSNPHALIFDSLSEDIWRSDLLSFMAKNNPETQTFFVVLPGLRRISTNYFGGYSSVQFDGSQEIAHLRAAKTLRAFYVHLDEMLSGIWNSRSGPLLFTIVSPYGATGPEGWHKLLRQITRRAAVSGFTDRGSDGLLIFLGDGIQRGPMTQSAQVVDLVPTLLYRLGLPVARDLDGSVLTSAFEKRFLARQPLVFVPSYETLTGAHFDQLTD